MTEEYPNQRLPYCLSIFLFIAFMLASCSASQQQPPPTSTNTPGHYYPAEGDALNIEFDYPPEWGTITSADLKYLNQIEIPNGALHIYDPNKPEPACIREERVSGEEIEGCFDNRPHITLGVIAMKMSTGRINYEHVLIDSEVVYIDGIEARMLTSRWPEGDVIEYAFENRIAYVSINVDFHVGEKTFYFYISRLPLDELNGEFHQVFLDILASIKFVD